MAASQDFLWPVLQ